MPQVLVVDDSSMTRRILKQALSYVGLGPEDIREAVNGQEALDLIEVRRPDLVLCDVNMPVLDGFGVLESLGGQLSTLPVVMVTSRTSLKTVRRLLSLGAREVIAKPFEMHRFHERITPYLEAAQGPDPQEGCEALDLIDVSALDTAVTRTLERMAFRQAARVETQEAAAPLLYAELDLLGGEPRALFIAATTETVMMLLPGPPEGNEVSLSADTLAELLNVLAGVYQEEEERARDLAEGETDLIFGLPRTTLVLPDDARLLTGLAWSIDDTDRLLFAGVVAREEPEDLGDEVWSPDDLLSQGGE